MHVAEITSFYNHLQSFNELRISVASQLTNLIAQITILILYLVKSVLLTNHDHKDKA